MITFSNEIVEFAWSENYATYQGYTLNFFNFIISSDETACSSFYIQKNLIHFSMNCFVRGKRLLKILMLGNMPNKMKKSGGIFLKIIENLCRGNV